MSPALPSGVVDVTNYTFHTPPAVGGRIAVRRVAPLPAGEQLRAAGQAYAQGIADLLAAEDLVVSPVDTLPSGSEFVTVTGRLPAEPGRAPQGSALRSALVRLSDKEAVNVEFVARLGDPRAEEQFREILRTLRPTPAGTDPVVRAFESVAATGPRRPVGPVTLDIPPEFRGPASAVFASADRRARFEVAVAQPPGAQKPDLFGPVAVATGDDGKPVRYELRPRLGGVQRAEAAVVAPESVTEELQRDGRTVRVTGTVAGSQNDARVLVESVLARLRPQPN